MRRVARFVLWAVLCSIGLLMMLVAAYFIRGSLEWFPTAEQTAKIRVVTGAMFLTLLALGVGITWILRRLRPSSP